MQRTHRFGSMPNFRSVIQHEKENSHPKLYRSSRPDFLSEVDLEEFKKLGIRSIIDCRAAGEYRRATGTKLLDHYYPCYKVKLPLFGEVPKNNVKTVPALADNPEKPIVREPTGKHFFIDFFKLNYIWMTFTKAPLWFRFYSMIYLIYDVIFKTGFRYWIRAFARQVLNTDENGLGGQYIDMINHSKASIYSALKLLSAPDNVPAMINCAHGKDRTGILSALVLSIMGRNRKEIITDYAHSTEGLSPIKDRVYFEIVTWLDMSPNFTRAEEHNMVCMLDYIEKKWGSVPAYLEDIGFTLEDQEKLRQNLKA